MDRSTHLFDASNHRLRRVGRLTRRRLRIEGGDLRNAIYTDGRLSVVIPGVGLADEDRPEMFQWWSNRPIALVIIRSTGEGGDISFTRGPVRWGTAVRVPGDGGISYIAFCHDTDQSTTAPKLAADRSPTSILARLLRSASPA